MERSKTPDSKRVRDLELVEYCLDITHGRYKEAEARGTSIKITDKEKYSKAKSAYGANLKQWNFKRADEIVGMFKITDLDRQQEAISVCSTYFTGRLYLPSKAEKFAEKTGLTAKDMHDVRIDAFMKSLSDGNLTRADRIVAGSSMTHDEVKEYAEIVCKLSSSFWDTNTAKKIKEKYGLKNKIDYLQ
jgi:hypothetical protein